MHLRRQAIISGKERYGVPDGGKPFWREVSLFWFSSPLLWHPADRKSGMVGTLSAWKLRKCDGEKGRPQRSIRMAPSSFSYERRLGALVPIWFFELYLFALQGKKFTSRGPIQRHVSSGSVGGLAVKGNAAQVKGASLASAWLSPCGVQGKRPCQGSGRSLWVRPRFRLASVRASVCRSVCWKGP